LYQNDPFFPYINKISSRVIKESKIIIRQILEILALPTLTHPEIKSNQKLNSLAFKKKYDYISEITAKSVIRRENLFYYLSSEIKVALCGIFFVQCIVMPSLWQSGQGSRKAGRYSIERYSHPCLGCHHYREK
jgi:hypothetical protein